MKLVKARVGLTNYYHSQVIRNPVMDIDSTIIDKMTEENISGGVSPSTLLMASVHSGGLNAQANGWSNIMGGWNESKGLMMMDFIVNDSPVSVEYMHVIGYVTNNSSDEGLTTDAVFTPVSSWKTHETITSSGYIDNPTTTRSQIGGRSDYLLNDGSQSNSMISLRPNDVMDFSIERAAHQDLVDRLEDEGLPGMVPTTSVAGTDISRVGVVASRRNNNNPTSYANDILTAGTGYQRNMRTSSNMLDNMGDNPNNFSGQFDELANLSYNAVNREPLLLRDDFFNTMCNLTGQSQLRGFNGYTVMDLQGAFENLNDVLDVTFMDKSQFGINDFTQNTESLGTSSTEEYVSQEITMTIMDLMIKRGLSAISFRGSNADNFAEEGGLSNIVILPYNAVSLKNDDFEMGNKVQSFIDDLTNQIFAKLNGLRPHELTPLRFDVTAELMGTCVINMVRVDDSNISNGFNMQDTGIPDGFSSRSYPTFALNNFSPVIGDKEQAQIAGSNFLTNLSTYFQ